ncbi:MAG: PqiC family protein [Gammaproteobacteria bacterium]|nr:PqiC family protein [Gammaproteobacteria bacterium]
MPRLLRCLTLGFLLVELVLLAGCVSPSVQQTRFYRLNPQPDAAGLVLKAEERSSLQPKVGLGPLELAGYLDRPQLIKRVGPYRLTLNDFEHWAGTLQDNIKAGLVGSLQARLGSHAVIAYPWHSAVRPRYELILDFSRFDAEAGNFVVQTSWTLLAERGDKLLAVRQLMLREPIIDDSPEALVAAASRSLARLAEQLASTLAEYP